MDIKYRLYPHPVLWDKNDDYKSSEFNCAIELQRDIKRFNLNAEFKLNNEELHKLVENGQAEFVLHIECPLTSYRKIISSSEQIKKIILKDENILGKISLCPFLVAKTDISNYSSIDFNEDYVGVSFNLIKGTILAIGTQQVFSVEKNNEDLSQVPSIFTIYKKETTEEMPIEIELNDNKIRIGLNIIDYENYSLHAQTKPEIVNAFLIYPTLIYVFERLKESFEDYSEYRWFTAINKMFKRFSLEFNEDLVTNKSSIELAQKVMGLPISNALKALVNIDNNSDEE